MNDSRFSSRARRIDMTDYRQSGEGANGASYDCLSDPQMMVKLYNKGYDIQSIVDELEVARKVFRIGVPSPEPGELVTDGERLGIRFRRISGKRSYARAIADEPHRLEEFVREFAAACKELHSIECPKGLFPEAKSTFLRLLEADTTLDERVHGRIAGFIRSIPDCTTALHGDMHIGNVLTTLPSGAPMQTPHQRYFIDLGYFESGCPLMDIGMLYLICNEADEAFVEHDFHISAAQAREVWRVFEDAYFFGPEKLAQKWFGPSANPGNLLEGLRPYLCLKALLVGFNLGFIPDSYARFVQDTFK